MKHGVVSKVRLEEEGKVRMISNLVLVPKKDQEFRAAFDGMSLNEYTVDVLQVISDVESVGRQLQPDHLVFITADLKDGFHHVKVEEEGTWLLVFYGPTSTELYRFLVAPFGARRSPLYSDAGWNTSWRIILQCYTTSTTYTAALVRQRKYRSATMR